jgi:hypothetical protein
MSTSLSLPPTERDFRIYERVILAGLSTRQAAGEFKLSQTRIRQLVQRVSQWLTESVPAQDEATDASHLRYAQHVAADRLDYFYCEAMQGWQLERQIKYLNLATRVLLAQSRLPVLPGTLAALAADAIEGPLPEGRPVLPERALADHEELPQPGPARQAGPTSAPPVEACSPSPSATPIATKEPTTATAVKPKGTESSGKLPPPAATARKAFFATAQPTNATGDESSVTEIKITPEQLGFSTKQLSRRERRRLRRKLGA